MEKRRVIEKTSRWCRNISVILGVLGCIGSLSCAYSVCAFLEDLTDEFSIIAFLIILLVELFVTVCGCLPLYALSVILKALSWQQQDMQTVLGASNKEVASTKCPQCGHEIAADAPFCGFCGTKLKGQ